MTVLDNILIGAHRHLEYGAISSLFFSKIARKSELEAREIADRSEENLTDYVLKVINDPNFMNSKLPVDLRNVGFSLNSKKGDIYSKGKENFKIRIEKNNFGLRKIRYWNHSNKKIYLIPITDGRIVTIYGNISTATAISIAKSIT